MTADAVRIEADGDDALIWVKAVPGASRDAIAGAVGERLKVKVSAPPEGGKANRAICGLLAAVLGVKGRAIEIERGHGHPEKVVRVAGTSAENVRSALRAG